MSNTIKSGTLTTGDTAAHQMKALTGGGLIPGSVDKIFIKPKAGAAGIIWMGFDNTVDVDVGIDLATTVYTLVEILNPGLKLWFKFANAADKLNWYAIVP